MDRGARRGRERAARWPAVLAVLAGFAAVPAHAADALYGLIVGIDDYLGTVNDLQGAVNDAAGIAAALRAAGADEVIELHDGQATKAAIRAGWQKLVAKAEPSDTIVFSYAGHGGQEPEPPGRHGEADGLNENFLLAGYQGEGPGSLERIVDDEMYEWLKEADNKGIEVVLVADSCHSGTMFRSAGSKTIRYRTG
ncbi:MAG: caspase family protein, partial [Bauldia sp.]